MSHVEDPQLNQDIEDGLNKANRNLKAISRKASRWTRVSVFTLALVIAVSLIGSGVAILDTSAKANKTTSSYRSQQADLNARFKAADKRQLGAIRIILCLAAKSSAESKERTPAEKAEAATFYIAALKKINALPCPPLHS